MLKHIACASDAINHATDQAVTAIGVFPSLMPESQCQWILSLAMRSLIRLRIEKTTPFGISLMRSLVLHRAAQETAMH